ncbi:MAG: PGPGW domain-containing protein [Candidatus Saccharimonadales bacterium]
MKRTYGTIKKAVVFIAGFTIIIAGLILLVIPGPGLLTIALGLLILSSEFEWAERHQKNIKKRIQDAYKKAKNKQKKTDSSRPKKK